MLIFLLKQSIALTGKEQGGLRTYAADVYWYSVRNEFQSILWSCKLICSVPRKMVLVSKLFTWVVNFLLLPNGSGRHRRSRTYEEDTKVASWLTAQLQDSSNSSRRNTSSRLSSSNSSISTATRPIVRCVQFVWIATAWTVRVAAAGLSSTTGRQHHLLRRREMARHSRGRAFCLYHCMLCC